jgi:hypothetical protein
VKRSSFIKLSLIVCGVIICLSAQLFLRSNVSLAQATQPAKATQIDQPKFALLVGVSKYKVGDSVIKPIEACRNNIPLLADTLIKDYGFKEENVDVSLIDEKATYEAITKKFRSHLIQNAEKAKKEGKEAVIVYYFCGHGSQAPNQPDDLKDETDDQKDETFVAYDSRTGNVPDILDDEIDDFKYELRKFTTNTTLIFESCNSGSASRDPLDDNALDIQETNPDKKVRKPYKRANPATTLDDVESYTAIEAAASDRNAYSESTEYCKKAFCKYDKPYSFMTQALVEALKRATPATTYRGLGREISSAVADLKSAQSPQIEGNRDAVLFGGAARRAKPYIEIDKILPDKNELIIRAGIIQGLKVGSQVSVYSSESETNTGKEFWLTNGVVMKVEGERSLVKVPKLDGIRDSSHVVLASPLFGGGSFLVALNPNGAQNLTPEEKSLRQMIEAELVNADLVKTQTVKLISSDKITPAESKESKGIIRLRKGKVKDIFYQPTTKKRYPMTPLKSEFSCQGNTRVANSDRFPADEAEVYYLDEGVSGGPPLFGKTFDPAQKPEKLAEEIAYHIKNYTLQINLKGLENTASEITSGVSPMVRVTIQRIPDNAIKVRCDNGKPIGQTDPELFKEENFEPIKNGKIPLNSYYKLKIENVSGEVRGKKIEGAGGYDFFITVLALNSTGGIRILYQSIGEKDFIPDGKEIPLSGRFRPLQAVEPLGTERYIVIVQKTNGNNKSIDFSFLGLSIGTKRISQSIFETILTQSGTKTRDAGDTVKDEPDQWGVIHLDLNVVR